MRMSATKVDEGGRDINGPTSTTSRALNLFLYVGITSMDRSRISTRTNSGAGCTDNLTTCPLRARQERYWRSIAVSHGEGATSSQVSATCADAWSPVGAPKAGIVRTEHTTGTWPSMTSTTVDG